MQAFAHFALAASIIVSALGAVVLCLLVIRYGFTPLSGARPREAARRETHTRLGHAVGAVCFALSAGLTSVAVGVQSRAAGPSSVPGAVVSEEVAREVQRVGDAQAQLTERVTAADGRVQSTEGSLEALRAEQARLAQHLAEVERTTARLAEAQRAAARAADAERAAPRAADTDRASKAALAAARARERAESTKADGSAAPKPSTTTNASTPATRPSAASAPAASGATTSGSGTAARAAATSPGPPAGANGSSTVTRPGAATPPDTTSPSASPGRTTVNPGNPPAPAPRSTGPTSDAVPASRSTVTPPQAVSGPRDAAAPRSNGSSSYVPAMPAQSPTVPAPFTASPSPFTPAQPSTAPPQSPAAPPSSIAPTPAREQEPRVEAGNGQNPQTPLAAQSAGETSGTRDATSRAGSEDIFAQAHRAMQRTPGQNAVKHVERLARDVKDAIVQIGHGIKSLAE
jgi:hypothetical protein